MFCVLSAFCCCLVDEFSLFTRVLWSVFEPITTLFLAALTFVAMLRQSSCLMSGFNWRCLFIAAFCVVVSMMLISGPWALLVIKCARFFPPPPLRLIKPISCKSFVCYWLSLYLSISLLSLSNSCLWALLYWPGISYEIYFWDSSSLAILTHTRKLSVQSQLDSHIA